MLLFDVTPFSRTKQIHTIPYNSISTIAILFKGPIARILVYVDSGYPLTLKFVGLTAKEKTKLRIMYNEICKKVVVYDYYVYKIVRVDDSKGTKVSLKLWFLSDLNKKENK